MRRPAMGGVPDRLLSRTPRRRLIAALCAIGATALAAGAIIGAGLPGSSQGASPRPKFSGASTVQRRDLVATDTESGTLSYATPQTVFNRISGTITSLPSVGQVVSPGGTLYQVDGQPIVLMNGSFPAYRDLSPAVSDGQDVLELNQNLVNLGFDPSRQITVDTVWQAATTSAVERWQASVGETQTGTVTLGQIVFLPGQQRITAVNTTLGSTGGSASAGSGSGSGSGTTASTTVTPRTEFVSLTTAKTTASAAQRSPSTPTPTSTSAATGPSTTLCRKPPTTPDTHKKKPKPTCPAGKSTSATPAQQLAALIALLKAETLELQKTKSNGSSASSKASKPASASATPSVRSGGGASGSGSGSGSSGAGASGAGASGAGSSGAGSGSSGAGSGSIAQAIMTTSSTQLVVTVNLDATKQSEAIVGEPVTVQLPTGGTVDGKISKVSPVAQTSSSSSSGSGSGAGGSSSTPTATIPVTITLAGHQATGGLDQAAVSVNFQQQKATGVLSVPVTALLATAGGGYAVQEAAAPHSLLPVTPGLFAAGYVQISGSGIFPGLQVTDSQG